MATSTPSKRNAAIFADTITTTGNVVIGGDLTVSGTTTTINTETINLADNIIVLNSNASGAATENAGIEIERGTDTNVSLIWDENNNRWTVGSSNFVAGTFIGALSGNASTASSAAKWTTARTLSLTGAVTGSVSIDGSGNVSITTTATSDPTLTLTGDVTGSATFTNLGNATLTATVANDSHSHSNYVLKTGDTMTGQLTMQGSSPQIKFEDTDHGDCWIHVNSNRFYVLPDRTSDGGWETPYALELNWSNNTGYLFANRIFADNYHPNADKWTTARTNTVTLTGDVTGSGSASVDGSGNWTVNVSTAVGNNSHTHDTIDVQDVRNTTPLPSGLANKQVQSFFNNQTIPNGLSGWYSTLTVKGWDGTYAAWELAGNATSSAQDGLFFRYGSTSWNAWQRVFTDNYHPNADKWTTARTNTVTLTGAVTGSGSASVDGTGNWTVTVPTTTNHTHNYDNYGSWTAKDHDGTTYTVTSGDTLWFKEGGAIDVNFTADDELTISHADTSTQGSVNNSNGTVIQDVTLDGYGHVTGLASLDGDARWVNKSGDTMTGPLTIGSTNDIQLSLTSTDSWTGITFNDSGANNDQLWHNGSTGTFAFGGGGSSVTNKKLHVDGGVTIGSSFDATAVTTDGLAVQSYITQESGKFVRASSNKYVAGGGSYYSSGTAGWYKVAQITVTGNCSGAVLYGKLFDRAYHDVEVYEIAAVIRAECDFTTNNESHFVEIGCTAVASSRETNYRNKIRVVLVGSTTNSRTYELQFYETSWNEDYWELWTSGWTVYDTPQAPGAATGTARVNYVSRMNADQLYANNDLRAPVFYDLNDTTYYSNPASTSNYNALNVGTINRNPVVTLSGAVTGSATMTNLGSITIATTATSDPTLTLTGDVTGSATFTNLGNATLTATVADNSHNHTSVPSVSTTAATSSYDNSLQYWQASGYDTNYAPSTDWYNTIRGSHGNANTYYSNTLAIKMTGSEVGTIWTQTRSNGNLQGWNKHWHSNNDGSGSGLDADTVDGIQGGSFLRSDASDSFTGDLTATSGNKINLLSGSTYGYDNYIYGGTDNYIKIEGVLSSGVHISKASSGTANLIVDGNIYGVSQNANYSNLYRFGGIYFTWDSDNYGTNFDHSITSSYGGTYGDDITINSYHRVRVNIDSNNNNGTSTEAFEIGYNTTGTGNLLFKVNPDYAYHVSDMRSPIFYDSANTAYYCDPASASRFNETNTNYCDIVANAAYGLRFWDGNSGYRIHMSAQGDATNGGRVAGETTSDYNMYFTMSGGTNRGFVFRNTNYSTGAIAGIDASGNGRFAGDVVAYSASDSRLKENITPIANALEKVRKLGGYEFDWNGKQTVWEEGKHDIGVIAQEVQAVVPEVTKERIDGYLGVDYEKLVPLLIEAIKEQQTQIDELKAQVQSLKEK